MAPRQNLWEDLALSPIVVQRGLEAVLDTDAPVSCANYRLSDDQRAHVDSLLKELGAESFFAREKAAKELRRLDPRYLLELKLRSG